MYTIEILIQNEVMLCQSSLVCDALSTEFFSYDDIVNAYVDKCMECGSNNIETTMSIKECLDCNEFNVDIEPQEIFEWWSIGSYLADKLKEVNAPVMDNEYGYWYGRIETGQSITMDYYLNKVVELINSN